MHSATGFKPKKVSIANVYLRDHLMRDTERFGRQRTAYGLPFEQFCENMKITYHIKYHQQGSGKRESFN